MILIIDNYDSFVYNLAQYIGELRRELLVFRNDAITVSKIEKLSPSHIIISPGSCTPREAGISNDVVRHFSSVVPIRGVCLAHQCIGQVYGAKIEHASARWFITTVEQYIIISPTLSRVDVILHWWQTGTSNLRNWRKPLLLMT